MSKLPVSSLTPRVQTRADTPSRTVLGSLTPYFQPILDLKTGRCVGLEALTRSSDPDVPQTDAAGFEGIYQNAETAQQATLQIAQRSMAVLTKLPDEAPALWLNVTGFDLGAPTFADTLAQMAQDHGLRLTQIVLELNEHISLGPYNGPLFQMLSTLRQQGLRIALDDFGVGGASLEHIRDWPVDIVKIDKSFVTGRPDETMLRSITDITCGLGQSVVAEGIEDTREIGLLRDLGCDLGQGFAFSPAVPETRLRAVLDGLNAAAWADTHAPR